MQSLETKSSRPRPSLETPSLSAATIPLYSLHELDKQSQPGRRGCLGGCCLINRLLDTGDLVLLGSSEHGLQHTLDRFSSKCGQMGVEFHTKTTGVLCLSRNPNQIVLQVSGNTCFIF